MRLFAAIACYSRHPWARALQALRPQYLALCVVSPPQSIRPRLQPQGTAPRQYAPEALRPRPQASFGGGGHLLPLRPPPDSSSQLGRGFRRRARQSKVWVLRRARVLPLPGTPPDRETLKTLLGELHSPHISQR
jgi:hypothetical protein